MRRPPLPLGSPALPTPVAPALGWALALPAFLLASACGYGDGVAPEPRAPEITVSGVVDGGVYGAPVTIVVTTDVGTYSATLNGADFFSGSTVTDPGSYVLEVVARNGTAEASVRVAFEIRLGSGGTLILRVFDLGENDSGGGGDALLVTDSTSLGLRHALVDAGPAGEGGVDLGYVAGRLEGLGVDTLEALVLSHAHTDHFDGMGEVLERVHVRVFYYNGQVRNFSRYTSLIAKALADADERVIVREPVEVRLGTGAATTLRILPPLATYLQDPEAGGSEINEGSLGTRVSHGAFSLFIAGDGEVEANRRWRTLYADDTGALTALKVAHHGANDAVFDNGSSGASAWIAHTAAALQLISANGTSHPRIRALGALLAQTSATYCTPVHGDIEVRVDPTGESWIVSVERNPNADCVPGRDATS